MSNYSKTTNFAVKDALLAGDPLKVIKGTDHDTEYNNIATAVATKTDNAAAAIVGGSINATPIGNSTPSTGAFTTLAATTLDSTPIGSVTPSTGKFSTLQATTLDSTPIGSVTPAAGTFTTLAATTLAFSAINNTPIGNITPSTGAFTTLSTTGTLNLSGAGAGQISFPATQNASAGANVLDDYEEGTFTGSVGGTATYNNQGGAYTKIGRLVYVRLAIFIAAIGTGSSTVMSGFPFAVGTNTAALNLATSNTVATAIVSACAVLAAGGGTSATVQSRIAASVSDAANAFFTSLTSATFSGVYEA